MVVSPHLRSASLCLAGWLVQVAAADDVFPYRLEVTADRVAARSGPGPQFYPTDLLSKGDVVEVYRHRDGDWLGIRPPRGSFSWVRRDQLQPASQPGVARVLRDDTVCRIGSHLAEVSEHAAEVYLEQDELVALLTDAAPNTATAQELDEDGWCRIAPPAGEFRWVRRAELTPASRQLPAGRTDLRPSAASASHSAEASPSADASVRLAADWQEVGSQVPRLSTAGVIQAVALQAARQAEPTESGSDSAGSAPADEHSAQPDGAAADESGGVEPAGVAADAIRLAPPRAPDDATAADEPQTGFSEPAAEEPGEDSAEVAGALRRPRWAPRGRLAPDELLEIELQLSRMAAGDVNSWQLQPLRARLEGLLPRLKPHTGRDEAAHLLERIAEFERLQDRYARVGDVAWSATGSPASLPPDRAAGAVPPPSRPSDAGGRFDGSGWLVPVHSTRRAAPPYALLDGEGEVLQYVSPAPGLNLHRYLRKPVGIHGQRGHSAALNKPHLTAERIVDLSRHQR